MRVQKRIQHLDEKPSHGNYVIVGRNIWAHGETLSQTRETFSKHGPWSRMKVSILNVTDDFQISLVDGSVGAKKVDVVYEGVK